MILVEPGAPAQADPAGGGRGRRTRRPRWRDERAAASPLRGQQADHRDAAPPGDARAAAARSRRRAWATSSTRSGATSRRCRTPGVDGLLFCNEADLPYQIGVGPEAVAAMAAVIGAVRSRDLPAVRRQPRLGPGREPRGGAGDRRQLRARGVHRRVRERPRRHAAGLRRDRRVPRRSARSRWRSSRTSPRSSPAHSGTATIAAAGAQRRLPGRRRDPHQRRDHRRAHRALSWLEAKAAVPGTPVLANTGVHGGHRRTTILADRGRRDRRHEPEARRRHLERRRPGARRSVHGGRAASPRDAVPV